MSGMEEPRPREFIPWPEPDDAISWPGAAASAASSPSATVSPQDQDHLTATAGSSLAVPASSPSALPLYLFLVVVALCCGSTGPSWFKIMGLGSSPITKAFWRMIWTSLVQCPLAALEMRYHGWGREQLVQWARVLPFAALPFGAAMGLHFVCVSGCVASTSFAHAMVLINTAPLFFTAFYLARHGLSRVLAQQAAQLPFLHPSRSPPPSPLEVAGALLAFLGVCALVSLDSASGDLPVTPAGDVLGLLASLFMAIYLCGGAYRGAMPLFCWMFPLHASAALVTGALALLAGATVDAGPNGLFGAWGSSSSAAGTLGAVLVPSMGSHSLINYLTPAHRLGPFVTSMFLNVQPLVGNVFGWAMGLQGAPSLMSFVCAPVIVAGTVLATLGKNKMPLTVLLCGACKKR